MQISAADAAMLDRDRQLARACVQSRDILDAEWRSPVRGIWLPSLSPFRDLPEFVLADLLNETLVVVQGERLEPAESSHRRFRRFRVRCRARPERRHSAVGMSRREDATFLR